MYEMHIVQFVLVFFAFLYAQVVDTTMELDHLDKNILHLKMQGECNCEDSEQNCPTGLLRLLDLDDLNSSLQDTCWKAGPSEARMEAQTHCTSALHLTCPSNSSGLFTGSFYDQKTSCWRGQDWKKQVTVPLTQGAESCCRTCPMFENRWQTWKDGAGATWHHFVLGYQTKWMRSFYALPWHEIRFRMPINVKQDLGLTILSLYTSIVIMDVDRTFLSNKSSSFQTSMQRCTRSDEIRFIFEWNGSNQQPSTLFPMNINFTSNTCASTSNNQSNSICLTSVCQKEEAWITEFGINPPFSIELHFPSGAVAQFQWSLVTDIMDWQYYDYGPPVILMSMAVGLVFLVCFYEHCQVYCEKRRVAGRQMLTQEDPDTDVLTLEDMEMILQDELEREM